ncbi:MAG: ABC transporter permease [Gemmatimonadaceae bacterium]
MIAGLIARVRSLWSGVRRGASLDAEMEAEFRFHMERRAADLVAQGLPPAAAVRQARIEFGSVERYKDEGRVQRGLGPFDGLRLSWLDFKLGFRMLVKYPGLTLVGGLTMAFAIGVGAAGFEVVAQIVSPRLPLDEGDRIVALQQWDAHAGRREDRVLHDFARWRAGLRSVTDLGAYRATAHNLIVADGPGEPVEVAEVTPSAFRLTRVPPALGRPLVDGDERPGAPNVVVIGWDVWQSRFAGDSGVLGATVRLGRTPATVVGVMPKGYRFPVFHDLWMPLRLDPLQHAAGEGPALRIVFGRLAPGATLRDAQAELDADARRAAADAPATHARLRPRAIPYTRSVFDLPRVASVGLWSVNVFLVMLLVLVCSNVALLTFARAAAREGEIVVRTALGASRARVVMQLVSEALVLSGVGLAVALPAARAPLARGVEPATGSEGNHPFG